MAELEFIFDNFHLLKKYEFFESHFIFCNYLPISYKYDCHQKVKRL